MGVDAWKKITTEGRNECYAAVFAKRILDISNDTPPAGPSSSWIFCKIRQRLNKPDLPDTKTECTI